LVAANNMGDAIQRSGRLGIPMQKSLILQELQSNATNTLRLLLIQPF
jgi:hypothetical protein